MDPAVLADYKKRQLLRAARHPTLPLTIWNYSPVCQYNKDLWDDVTMTCRGLVTTDDGTVVGRSFRKFFNLGEGLHTPTEQFTVQEKLDGSLGILFYFADQWIIASRGSFVSPQAQRAQKILKKYDISELDRDTSYVFEIIYPDNRIVVDYGSMEALVFLAAFKRTGEEVFPPDLALIERCGFPVCKTYPEFSDYSELQKLDWRNHEGFVVRFSDGGRMKIKFETYLQLHKSATNLSTRTVFEWFSGRKSLAELLDTVADEFHDWVRAEWSKFQEAHDELHRTLKARVERMESLSQKEFAQAIKDEKDKHLLFGLRARKDDAVFSGICKLIEPTEDVPKVWQTKQRQVPVSEDEKPTLTFMIGVSGSGKSTFAKTLADSRSRCVIVSRDHLRQQLFGLTDETVADYHAQQDTFQKEVLVTECQRAQIEAALRSGYHVIVDDTNLRPKYIRELTTRFSTFEHKFELMECTLEEACERQERRMRKVERGVIEDQLRKLETLKPQLPALFPGRNGGGKIIQNPELPKAIIVDMDGTLALTEGRDPYNWALCGTDPVNEPVRAAVRAMFFRNYAVLICSGRPEEARPMTSEWLKRNNVPHDRLMLRPSRDERPDFVVKREMWEQITKDYNVVCMFDDRTSVVNYARQCGFTVFQVAEGNF